VTVVVVGEYEDHLLGNSTWSSGDWNGDGDFTTSDMVLTFVDGGYEQGSRPEGPVAPEPGGWLPLMWALSLWMVVRRSRCPV
jgi:hypothetical protein